MLQQISMMFWHVQQVKSLNWNQEALLSDCPLYNSISFRIVNVITQQHHVKIQITSICGAVTFLIKEMDETPIICSA